jgi:hypothetical protein
MGRRYPCGPPRSRLRAPAVDRAATSLVRRVIPTYLLSPVRLSIAYPYSATSMTARLTDIPNAHRPMSTVRRPDQAVPVTNGAVHLNVPAVADGDAYVVRLSPNSD